VFVVEQIIRILEKLAPKQADLFKDIPIPAEVVAVNNSEPSGANDGTTVRHEADISVAADFGLTAFPFLLTSSSCS
jgi:hypothetical protein